jgi:hypothetical protein
MTLKNVIDNLNTTISGKQELLDILMNNAKTESSAIEFLKINIGELRRIREDLLKVKIPQQAS